MKTPHPKITKMRIRGKEEKKKKKKKKTLRSQLTTRTDFSHHSSIRNAYWVTSQPSTAAFRNPERIFLARFPFPRPIHFLESLAHLAQQRLCENGRDSVSNLLLLLEGTAVKEMGEGKCLETCELSRGEGSSTIWMNVIRAATSKDCRHQW